MPHCCHCWKSHALAQIFQPIKATVCIAMFIVNSIPSFENSVDPDHLVSDDVWRLNEKFEKKVPSN